MVEGLLYVCVTVYLVYMVAVLTDTYYAFVKWNALLYQFEKYSNEEDKEQIELIQKKLNELMGILYEQEEGD